MARPLKVEWSEDRIETMKRLWLAGLTATQVAEELGGVSRNAVIGKVHRLGLGRASPRVMVAGMSWKERRALEARQRAASRQNGPRPQVKVKAKPQHFAEKKQAPEVVAIADAVVPLMLDLVDLGNGCKWPYGDGPFHFCGNAKPSDRSYCAAHHRVAFTCEAKPKQRPRRQRDTIPRRSNDDWFRGVAA